MKQHGFTLVEIMFVTVVIAVLLIIALPMYQQYSIRARVSEGLNLASSAKIAVSEVTFALRVLPTSQGDTAYVSPAPTDNVALVEIGNAGIITITYTPKAGDGTMVLKPALLINGGISWDCKSGTLASEYRPANCR